jgi:hypothetical protein
MQQRYASPGKEGVYSSAWFVKKLSRRREALPRPFVANLPANLLRRIAIGTAWRSGQRRAAFTTSLRTMHPSLHGIYARRVSLFALDAHHFESNVMAESRPQLSASPPLRRMSYWRCLLFSAMARFQLHEDIYLRIPRAKTIRRDMPVGSGPRSPNPSTLDLQILHRLHGKAHRSSRCGRPSRRENDSGSSAPEETFGYASCETSLRTQRS